MQQERGDVRSLQSDVGCSERWRSGAVGKVLEAEGPHLGGGLSALTCPGLSAQQRPYLLLS